MEAVVETNPLPRPIVAELELEHGDKVFFRGFQEKLLLLCFFLKLADALDAHARRTQGQFHYVKIVDHPGLQRRVQAAAHQFTYSFAEGDLMVLRVCPDFLKHIIIKH